MTAQRPVLLMIDGHAVAYRQFFALPLENFNTQDGEPTNATFGFARTLLDVLENDQPMYLAVAFDQGMSGRDALYPDYKGTREKMPDELRVQLDRIRELVEAFNIPIVELEGHEADDVIGTLARQAEATGVDVLIVTGDRDLLQLVTAHTRVRLPSRKRGESDPVYGVEDFNASYDGLQPPQLVDLKALMGDSSDNIPGIKGIGEKTGIKLLKAYGSLSGIYEHIEDIKGSQRQKLDEGRDLAFLSQDLARIRRDLPLELDLSACVARDFERDRVAELFRQLEFRLLIGRLSQVSHAQGDGAPAAGAAQQMSLFGDDAPVSAARQPIALPEEEVRAVVETVVIQDEAALHALVKRLNQAEAIGFDVETTSVDQMQAELVGISLAVEGERGYYIPVGHIAPPGEDQEALLDEAKIEQLPLAKVIAALTPPMTSPDIPKYGHNAKYDLVVLRRHGLDVKPITFDTMIAEWLSDPESRNKGLKSLAWIRLNEEMTEITSLIGSGKNQVTFDRVPIDRAAPYAAADAALTYRLVDGSQPEDRPLRPVLKEKHLYDLFNNLEIPLIPVLGDMEMAGITLDTAFLAQMSDDLSTQLAQLEKDIFASSGGYGEFNINSPKQLNDVLFGKLGIPTSGLRKTTHGFSTSADVLEDLRASYPGQYPILELILQHRELTKLKGTYVDALPQLVNPQTGRLHTSFNQTGTVTGRISSDNPNLQNIPVRTETGRAIREAFIAPPGYVLLAVDYSQVELRVLAHISEDKTLLDAFAQGQDIHRATAAAVYGIPFDQVTKEQRYFAKRVNFGLLYGMGAFRLSRESDLTLAQAEEFISAYFERLPGVRRYLDDTKRLAYEQGYLETLLGRRRDFSILQTTSNRVTKQAIERQAINMPIQGTAADIMKQAMITVHERLGQHGYDARMLLQVHDELVLEVAQDALHDVTALVQQTMEGAFALKAPLRADAQFGSDWLHMQAGD